MQIIIIIGIFLSNENLYASQDKVKFSYPSCKANKIFFFIISLFVYSGNLT